jgi:hypothetical protein
VPCLFRRDLELPILPLDTIKDLPEEKVDILQTLISLVDYKRRICPSLGISLKRVLFIEFMGKSETSDIVVDEYIRTYSNLPS